MSSDANTLYTRFKAGTRPSVPLKSEQKEALLPSGLHWDNGLRLWGFRGWHVERRRHWRRRRGRQRRQEHPWRQEGHREGRPEPLGAVRARALAPRHFLVVVGGGGRVGLHLRLSDDEDEVVGEEARRGGRVGEDVGKRRANGGTSTHQAERYRRELAHEAVE
eukprot:4865153-Pleurochrysis_carterae.AAC.1